MAMFFWETQPVNVRYEQYKMLERVIHLPCDATRIVKGVNNGMPLPRNVDNKLLTQLDTGIKLFLLKDLKSAWGLKDKYIPSAMHIQAEERGRG